MDAEIHALATQVLLERNEEYRRQGKLQELPMVGGVCVCVVGRRICPGVPATPGRRGCVRLVGGGAQVQQWGSTIMAKTGAGLTRGHG